jgi:DNA-binding transcriptional regulator YiaG
MEASGKVPQQADLHVFNVQMETEMTSPANMPVAAQRLIRAGDRAGRGDPPQEFKNFSDEVRELRTRLCLTQEEFCLRYNVPIGNLRNWEQKGRVTSPDTASRLLIAMISVDADQVATLIARTKVQRQKVMEETHP